MVAPLTITILLVIRKIICVQSSLVTEVGYTKTAQLNRQLCAKEVNGVSMVNVMCIVLN